MENKHEEQLTSTYHSLMAFYANSIVPRHTDDIQGKEKWIIDKEEKEAIEVILSLLIDCGAKNE